MINYIVIGICILLLVAVIYVSAKPINMGIEARRNLKNNIVNEDQDEFDDANDSVRENTISKISEEVIKLRKLKDEGALTQEEYEKAKKKLLD
tara:strand:- start:874 stop:1152 length:279 start_codon:yes stop_codon:yes gene_type:complete